MYSLNTKINWKLVQVVVLKSKIQTRPWSDEKLSHQANLCFIMGVYISHKNVFFDYTIPFVILNFIQSLCQLTQVSGIRAIMALLFFKRQYINILISKDFDEWFSSQQNVKCLLSPLPACRRGLLSICQYVCQSSKYQLSGLFVIMLGNIKWYSFIFRGTNLSRAWQSKMICERGKH